MGHFWGLCSFEGLSAGALGWQCCWLVRSAQGAALLWGEALGADTGVTVPWLCCWDRSEGAFQSCANCAWRHRNEASSAGEEWLGSWPVLIIELLQQEHAPRLSSSTAFKSLIGTPCEVS